MVPAQAAPEYTISGKTLISKQRAQLSPSQSNSPENINNMVINANNNSNIKINNNIHGDKKASTVLTGKAAVSATKNDPKMSYFVTNKLIEKTTKKVLRRKNQLIRNSDIKIMIMKINTNNTNSDSEENNDETNNHESDEQYILIKATLNQSDLETEYQSCQKFILYPSRFE